MKRSTAVTLRRLALCIEVVCMLGLLSLLRGIVNPPEPVLGVPLYRVLQVGLGIGLALWCFSTYAYRRAVQRGDLDS
jgi:hypothetical protein